MIVTTVSEAWWPLLDVLPSSHRSRTLIIGLYLCHLARYLRCNLSCLSSLEYGVPMWFRYGTMEKDRSFIRYSTIGRQVLRIVRLKYD
jgi:hypothetical protein